MKISEFKNHLTGLDKITFILPDGKKVPAHFHVTEVGRVESNFIDCGSTVRKEVTASFQLWSTIDYTHRLSPDKLIKIIDKGDELFQINDLDIEVEYQGDTISKYGLDFKDDDFLLTTRSTACLAQDLCGIPEKISTKLSDLKVVAETCCTPGSGCC